MTVYDVLVIGGGPGGYVAAERAGNAGLSVALAEKRALGGVCLNEGCIPSKALLNSAKIYHYATHGQKSGVTVENAVLDHATVIGKKNRVVKKLVNGIKATMKQANVEVIPGEAYIIGQEDGLFQVRINDQQYAAKNLILATGSAPVLPPITGMSKGIENGFILTSSEMLNLPEPPKQLVIVGGGVIGLEMASYYKTAGSQVTIIEMLDHIGGEIDEEIGRLLQKKCESEGIVIRLGCRVTAFEQGKVLFSSEAGDEEAEADCVLASIGRKPVLDGFGLENLNVATDRGCIVTDEFLRTNIPHLYAIGDINGKYMLAHVASREGEVAVNHILGIKDEMSYKAVPQAVYTAPEVAQIGETEKSAGQLGLDYQVVTLPMQYSGRYVAETDGDNGICKLIIDRNSHCLLGAGLISPYASEIIYGLAVMMEQKMTIDDVKRVIFPHPTVGEIIREAVFHG